MGRETDESLSRRIELVLKFVRKKLNERVTNIRIKKEASQSVSQAGKKERQLNFITDLLRK